MKRFKITRNAIETIEVEGRNAADALENANDYSNQYNWSTTRENYQVEEV